MAQVEPYGLDPTFERCVLWYCASSTTFWSRVGHVMEADAFEDPSGLLIFKVCGKMATELGRGPGSTVAVMQRLHSLKHQGKLTGDQLNAVLDLFDDVEDHHVPDLDVAINELLPLLKHRMHSAAILKSHNAFAKRGDFTDVQQLFSKAERLGEVDQVATTRLDGDGFARIAAAKVHSRMPYGVLELDMKMEGGAPRKTLSMWMADTGGGKSIALAHEAAESMREQVFTGFITLELPEHVQLARIYANLTGVPINHILNIKRWRDEAQRRMEIIAGSVGIGEVAEFSPLITTVEDIIEWIDQQEQKHGAKMDKLVLDYADKLHDPRAKSDNQYSMMLHVYEDLRRKVAMERDMWVSTGSQSKGRDRKSGVLGTKDTADSIHKARVADIVITINPEEEGSDNYSMFVAKNRLGISKHLIGPLVNDFAKARLVPASKELGPW